MITESNRIRHFLISASVLLMIASVLLALPAAAQAVAPYTIQDTGTGGECLEIGVWDNVTKTCTMTRDLPASEVAAGAIVIGNNGGVAVTLDGAGHSITGPGANQTNGNAISLTSAQLVTLRNLKISGFNKAVLFSNSDTNTVTGSELRDNKIGIALETGTGNTQAITIVRNLLSGNTVAGITLDQANLNTLQKNTITGSPYGIMLSGSNLNVIDYNTISGSSSAGIYMVNGIITRIRGNSITSNINGVTISGSLSLDLYNNRFLDNSFGSHIFWDGAGFANNFNKPAGDGGGNYYDTWDEVTTGPPLENCTNANNDRFCDSAYTSPYGTVGAVDNFPLARRSYYFTWYDQASPGVKNWILMANPIDGTAFPAEDAWFDLSIAGANKALPASVTTDLPGQVIPMSRITPSFPGVMDGPVEVGYNAKMRQIVSQRVLWGDSLDEITGTDAARLSNLYHWTWYDQQSPGFRNWILIGNPNEVDVKATITIAGAGMTNPASGTTVFDIPAGGRITPEFPGVMGGPVMVHATRTDGITPAQVIASQRVLSNNGAAFNEEPGIPDNELSSRYVWTWYDMTGSAKNWVIIANPSTAPLSIYYEIRIGATVEEGGPIPIGGSVARTFPGTIGGPVHVKTFTDPLNKDATLTDSIVSQRSIWGPSFEEVPGERSTQLFRSYFWTWYDQQSADVTNWVLVSNPTTGPPEPVFYSAGYEIRIGGVLVTPPIGDPAMEHVNPGETKTYTFPGTMNGPVEVRADNNVISSQRVIWKGHFNEVMGTNLD